MTRYNTRPCPSCGARTSVLAEIVGHEKKRFEGWGTLTVRVFRTDKGATLYGSKSGSGAPVFPCRQCGKARVGLEVVGRMRANKKCDARCLSGSTGKCECACGGKNHGAAWE